MHESFNTLELFGFILLVLGTLVYNEIIVLPFWGFDKNTKAAIQRRHQAEHLVDIADEREAIANKTSDDYMATSPHAGYDAQRNVRILKKKLNDEITKGDEEIHMHEDSDTDSK